MAKPKPTRGATETTLDFATPGQIAVSSSTGGNPITVNLEQIWPTLNFTAYDAEALREWESVFLRLALQCREILGRT